jgi:AcrR family transcriptional regulator
MTSKRKPSNRELRTRKDLLLAASRLMKLGRKPTIDEVAEEALVSRATAYRYFSNVEALLVEAPIEAVMADPVELFAGDFAEDAETRIDRAEAFLHEVVCRNEAQLRLMLAHSINRDPAKDAAPARQNRRLPLIEEALAPVRSRFAKSDYERLCATLALIFGPESMIVFRDVLHVDWDTARSIKSWAVRALVRAALQEVDANHAVTTRAMESVA